MLFPIYFYLYLFNYESLSSLEVSNHPSLGFAWTTLYFTKFLRGVASRTNFPLRNTAKADGILLQRVEDTLKNANITVDGTFF